MARIDVISKLLSNHKSALEFNYDALMAPPIYSILTPTDVNDLHEIATSIKLNSKINKKYKMMDEIMTRRGFREFHAGTNRRIYSFPDYKFLMAKVAIDESGLPDNVREYKNQAFIKPHCTKVFEVTPRSTVGFFERVSPIQTRAEFMSVSNDIYELITNKIIGEYVLADIGTEYFMNWGIREGFGPVLLDFPYVYKLDGNKLECNNVLFDGTVCDGMIDYDAGFNELVCNKCNKIYQASELRSFIEDHKINIERGIKYMQTPIIQVYVGDKLVKDTGAEIRESKKIQKPRKNNYKPRMYGALNVSVSYGDAEVIDGHICSNTIGDQIDGKEILNWIQNEVLHESEKPHDLSYNPDEPEVITGEIEVSEAPVVLEPEVKESKETVVEVNVDLSSFAVKKDEVKEEEVNIKEEDIDEFLYGNQEESSEDTTDGESETEEVAETEDNEYYEETITEENESSENDDLNDILNDIASEEAATVEEEPEVEDAVVEEDEYYEDATPEEVVEPEIPEELSNIVENDPSFNDSYSSYDVEDEFADSNGRKQYPKSKKKGKKNKNNKSYSEF